MFYMALTLSTEEIEEVIYRLSELLPGREIIKGSMSSLAIYFGSGDGKIGSNTYRGKPVTLEDEIAVFYSVYSWKLGPERGTVEKHRPGSFEIWVEKMQGGDEESKEVIQAFGKAGISPHLNNFHRAGPGLFPEEKRKNFYASEDIMYPDVNIPKLMPFDPDDDSREKIKEILLIHPGDYSIGKRYPSDEPFNFDYRQANEKLYIVETDPTFYEGRINNCNICRGKQYENKSKVKFLMVHDCLVSCEYCIDDYLGQISAAFKGSPMIKSDFANLPQPDDGLSDK